MARVRQRRAPEAIADLTEALKREQLGWVRTRTYLELGQGGRSGGQPRRAPSPNTPRRSSPPPPRVTPRRPPRPAATRRRPTGGPDAALGLDPADRPHRGAGELRRAGRRRHLVRLDAVHDEGSPAEGRGRRVRAPAGPLQGPQSPSSTPVTASPSRPIGSRRARRPIPAPRPRTSACSSGPRNSPRPCSSASRSGCSR